MNEKWDRRGLQIAFEVSQWSKDPSTKVGAYIANPDNTPVSFGYNGFPRGMSDDPNLYADRETKYSRIIHAEINALLNATASVKGCTMYSTMFPCSRCAVQIIQAGITRVVGPKIYVGDRWAEECVKAYDYFKEARVTVKEWPYYE